MALNERGCELHECDWRELAEVAKARGGVDALIVDAPYSSHTHDGHDTAAEGDWRPIDYAAWTPEIVREFVELWAPLTRGWIVSLTDTILAQSWRDAMGSCDRVTFTPVPAIESGMTVRKHGDGPSNWTVQACPSRPRGAEWLHAWSPSPFYLVPREAKPIPGGKTIGLMRRIVADYTRPGDLVCDPCMGAASTGVACIAEGRRFLGGDADASHVAIAAERLRSLPAAPNRTGTLSLFSGVGT